MIVSILLPTRDRKDWLPQAIGSVKAQTSARWELVILDNSDEPYYTLPFPDPRIRYQHRLCDGVADAYTQTVRLAAGDILVPLADDDQLHPECVATVLEVFADPTVQWANAVTEITDMAGNVVAHRGGTPESVALTRQGSYWLGGAVWWRTHLTERVAYEPRFDGAADFALYLRFLAVSDPLLVPQVMYLYRDHPGTDSRRRHGNQQQMSTAIVDERNRGGLAGV